MTAPDSPLGAGDALSSEKINVEIISRFEFEAGKGNEGTKILMVQWDAPDEIGNWEVSWAGKSAVLGVGDSDANTTGNLHRLYFLLPPGAHVPALVSICRKDGEEEAEAGKGQVTVLQIKPMPAIFPAELTGGREAGRLGVLHTLWAKRRLAELQGEIATEMRTNGESVGLEMALRDRQWIVDHFGLTPGEGVPRATRLHIPESDLAVKGATSPKSPIGGRLGEKLRGLKLATSPAELAAAAAPVPRSGLSQHVSSASAAAVPRSTPSEAAVASLDAIVGGGGGAQPAAREDNTEEDLFALPMSPRSPEMKKSPFSLL